MLELKTVFNFGEIMDDIKKLDEDTRKRKEVLAKWENEEVDFCDYCDQDHPVEMFANGEIRIPGGTTDVTWCDKQWEDYELDPDFGYRD